ncbi:metallophosphoesterase family protein [Candidatus Dependentiae bacterium]
MNKKILLVPIIAILLPITPLSAVKLKHKKKEPPSKYEKEKKEIITKIKEIEKKEKEIKKRLEIIRIETKKLQEQIIKNKKTPFKSPLLDQKHGPSGKKITKKKMRGPIKPPTFAALSKRKFKLSKKEFERVANEFIKSYKKSRGIHVIKYIVNPGTQLAIHGDFHGDKNAIFKYVKDLVKKGYLDKSNPFKIKKNKKNFYLVFLGDYTDRGKYGTEVLYTIMRLKIENHSNVIVIRGNHEDIEMNVDHGFGKELMNKLGYGKNKWRPLLKKVYNILPSAVYLRELYTPNYILLCHGGLEPRFNPRKLFATPTKTYKTYKTIKKLETEWLSKDLQDIIKTTKIQPNLKNPEVYDIGFLWSDFIVNEKAKTRDSKRGEGIVEFGKNFTQKFLKECSETDKYEVITVFRGHQHSDTMMDKMLENHGIFNLWSKYQWDGSPKTKLKIPKHSVWTLNASPKGLSDYKYDYDTYAILKLNKNFKDWELQPVNIKIKK